MTRIEKTVKEIAQLQAFYKQTGSIRSRIRKEEHASSAVEEEGQNGRDKPVYRKQKKGK